MLLPFHVGSVVVAQTPSRPSSSPSLQPSRTPTAAATLAPDAGRVPAERRYMPTTINEPLMSMTIQAVQELPGRCIYRSRHFEFTTPVKLGTAAMKEICRAFESTHELVSKLPWGINPWPESGPFFRAELFQTRREYLATGAPEWSGGVYSLNDGIFRIPFDQVGVVSRGDSFYLGGAINNDTITHEVTHQMMHEYLRYMPVWLVEGLAEYTSNLPYMSGRYNVTGALEGFKQMRRNVGKDKRRGQFKQQRSTAPAPKWVGAEELWGFTTSIIQRRPVTDSPKPVTRSNGPGIQLQPPSPSTSSGPSPEELSIMELPNRYFSGHALVFFFMHLDGDGKATRLKKYFDAIHEERKLWVDYQGALAAYREAGKKYLAEWEAFKKVPGVIDLGGGQIRYPSNLRPPTEPKPPTGPGGIDPNKVCAKHLPILLAGRSLADLDREVRAAFEKVESPL